MKITKLAPNSDPDTWVWEGTCRACDTEVECSGNVGRIYNTVTTGLFIVRKCPVCYYRTGIEIHLHRKNSK